MTSNQTPTDEQSADHPAANAPATPTSALLDEAAAVLVTKYLLDVTGNLPETITNENLSYLGLDFRFDFHDLEELGVDSSPFAEAFGASTFADHNKRLAVETHAELRVEIPRIFGLLFAAVRCSLIFNEDTPDQSVLELPAATELPVGL